MDVDRTIKPGLLAGEIASSPPAHTDGRIDAKEISCRLGGRLEATCEAMSTTS